MNKAAMTGLRALRKKSGARYVLVAVAFALMLAMALLQGCSAEAGPSAAAQGGNATRQVVDSEGRTVQVPEQPENVAVLDSFCGEASVMLGAGDHLYSVPGGTMSDKILQDIYPGLTNLAKASGGSVNIEDLVANKVDLVLAKSSLAQAERTKLENAKIPYVVIGYETLEEQLSAFDVVADALGPDAKQRGEKIRSSFDQMVALVDANAAKVPADQHLRVYHAINDALLTDAAGSLGASWISRVGAESVSAGEQPTSGTDYTATLEAVYDWSPDAVICNVASTAQAIREDAKWASLGAVSTGRVYAIPIGATRWGQRGSVETPLAMLWLGCTLYPDEYANIDLKATVTDFYQNCLNVEVDDELYEKIISGEGIRTNGNGSGSGGGK